MNSIIFKCKVCNIFEVLTSVNNVSQTGLRSSWCCRRRSPRLWSRRRLIWSSCRRANRSERSWTVSRRSSEPHSTQHTSSFLQTSTIWPRRNWKENSNWSKESSIVAVVLSRPIKSYRVFIAGVKSWREMQCCERKPCVRKMSRGREESTTMRFWECGCRMEIYSRVGSFISFLLVIYT